MVNKKLVIANWKLNPRKASRARVLVSRIEHGMMFVNRGETDVVLCPPYVFLPGAKTITHFTVLGAQDVSHEEQGAFTGEVSADQLKEFEVRYVIVGHSDRRILGESDELINQKLRLCLKKGLRPVLCVGFGTKKSHNKGTIKRMIAAQLKRALQGLKKAQLRRVSVAYEPVWAVSKGLGTGKSATPEHAREMIDYIHSKYQFDRVIYGGSITSRNAGAFAEAGLEGALVGGASLDAEGFLEIIKAFGGNGTL